MKDRQHKLQILTILLVASLVKRLALVDGVAFAQHPKGYLSACLLARDENHDIREWVEYHLWAGVEKVYLFDHESAVPMIKEISDYVVEGKVQYTYFKSTANRLNGPNLFGEGLQGRVMRQCFMLARGLYTWMMFTDMDEFMVVTDPKYNNSIPAVLREFEQDAGSVLVHWVRMGSAGVQQRAPGQAVLPTFTKCMLPPDTHLKGIAHLEHASVGFNAHSFAYRGGRVGLRAGDRARATTTHALPNATYTPLALYHYVKSVAEYTQRFEKQNGGISGLTNKTMDLYEHVDKMSTEDCLVGKQAWEAMPKRPKPEF